MIDYLMQTGTMNAMQFQREKDMNTDALLQPLTMDKNQVIALMDVVKANTAAFKEIRKDLGQCNSQEKVQAIINKVEMAVQDLAIESQKIPPWVKDLTDIDPIGSSGSEFYGQYIINQPLNRDNPVPWPPGYALPADPTTLGTTTVGGKK
jgi:hypothetical protein